MSPTEKGQSLIEVLIALVIASIMIISLIFVILTGLKNAQFAQNQAKATKYAQEAIDKIRAIKEQGGTINLASNITGACGANACSAGTCAFGDLWSCYLSSSDSPGSGNPSPCTILPNGSSKGCYFQLSGSGSATTLNEPLSSNVTQTLPDGLTREIFISDINVDPDYTKEKTISVKVKWSDASGEHESNLQTILANY